MAAGAPRNPKNKHPNNLGFSTINSLTPDSPRVGEVRSLRTPMRIVQFGLKLFF